MYSVMIMFKKKTSDLLQSSFADPLEMPSRDQVIIVENCRLFWMMIVIFYIHL